MVRWKNCAFNDQWCLALHINYRRQTVRRICAICNGIPTPRQHAPLDMGTTLNLVMSESVSIAYRGGNPKTGSSGILPSWDGALGHGWPLKHTHPHVLPHRIWSWLMHKYSSTCNIGVQWGPAHWDWVCLTAYKHDLLQLLHGVTMPNLITVAQTLLSHVWRIGDLPEILSCLHPAFPGHSRSSELTWINWVHWLPIYII